MPNGKRTVWSLALAAGFLLLGSTDADAGIDIDFGAAVTIGDDTDLYLSVSSRYFERDRNEVEGWYSRFNDPDDLAVALFVSRRSGRSVHHLAKLRGQGMSWWEISARVGMSPDVWFPPVERDPGPPYGKAYGYWKKRDARDPRAYALTDADARHLVAARILGDYYRVPVEVAMEWRSSGANLESLVSREYRQRHGKAHQASAKAKRSHGKNKGKKGRK